MADPAHEAADRAVDEVMAEVRETYLQAQMDAQEALSTYLASFEREDAAELKLVESGELSERDYRSWRASKVLTGKRYASLLDQVSWGYEHANEVAMAALEGRLPEVYAENANFAAYSVCEATGAAIPFDMMSADAVQQMVANGADLFPVPSVNAAKDVAWSRKLMASQLTQGLLLGESMPKVARRIQSVTDSNWATALRTARTTVTAAENAGRVESYRRAKDMGIQLKKQWMATLDGRTRHSHRQLDGEAVAEDEKFSNGCRYPGDPEARYAETMNCRCTLIAAVEGFEHDLSDLTQRWGKLPEGMTYEQWKGEGLRRKQPTADEQRRASMKPVNEKLYASKKNYVERHGGVVMRGGADVERHLDEMGADAASLEKIIFFRENPTTSEVLEEVFHFEQHERGDYSGMEPEETRLRREIDAQKYLIEAEKRYNIPKEETEQTKRALEEYERLLSKFEGGKP